MVDPDSPRLSSIAAEFLARAPTCESIAALDQHFLSFAHGFGFETAMCVNFSSAGSAVVPRVIFGENDPWIPYYADRNYASLDPTVVRAFRSREAFTWRDAERPDDSRQVRQFFGEAREAWAHDGLIVPIHGPFGELSVVNLLSDANIDLSGEEVAMLHGVCCIYATLGLNLSEGVLPMAPLPAPTLSRRERQCIYWMSVGKHDVETAKILGISPHTVRIYLDGAKEKFMVETRPELCLKALACGLLVPDRGVLS